MNFSIVVYPFFQSRLTIILKFLRICWFSIQIIEISSLHTSLGAYCVKTYVLSCTFQIFSKRIPLSNRTRGNWPINRPTTKRYGPLFAPIFKCSDIFYGGKFYRLSFFLMLLESDPKSSTSNFISFRFPSHSNPRNPFDRFPFLAKRDPWHQFVCGSRNCWKWVMLSTNSSLLFWQTDDVESNFAFKYPQRPQNNQPVFTMLFTRASINWICFLLQFVQWFF